MFAKQRLFVLVLGEVYSHSAKFLCSVCGKGVERNSMKCIKYTKWVHNRYFGMQDNVKMAVSFVCKRCQHLVHANSDKRVTLDGDDLEVVDRFP